MKVELKLTYDQIKSAANLLASVYNSNPTLVKEEKIIRSIAFDLADKIQTKNNTLIKNQTLFNRLKNHKITLKFHEAHALHEIIIDALPHIKDIDIKNQLDRLKNDLNQKTA